MKLGFMHNMLGCGSLDEAFALAARVGAEGLEVNYGVGDIDKLQQASHAGDLTSLSKRHNVAIPSIGLGFLCKAPTLIGPPAQTAKAQRLLAAAIDLATEIGVKTVLVPFFGENALELEDELAKAIDALSPLAQTAEEAGVALGVESNLNFSRQQFLLNHFADTGSVKIYYDTGNAAARKLDLPTGIRQLGLESIAQVHFKDVRIAEGSPPDFNVGMGEGNVDFRAVLQALKAVGYDGWIILETPPGNDPALAARTNLEFARNLLR